MPGALVVRSLQGLALVQDAGRGFREAGVPASGAFAPHAHALATTLVGGGPQDAGLEVVGSITLTATVPCTIAATGAVRLRVGGRGAAGWTALDVPAGVEVEVVTPRRAWLAVAGGLRVPPVLGSRATCLLGPLGPPPVALGDRLPMAAVPRAATAGDYARAEPEGGPLRLVPGPHLALAHGWCEVVASSRIGVRVRAAGVAPWGTAASASLPSLGVLPGTLQVLPTGEAVLLGPDAGTMGGYPIAGVVCRADLDRLAAAMPGDRLELAPVEVGAAPVARPLAVVRVGALPG
jgi:allophanate hydrolase subunit 2